MTRSRFNFWTTNFARTSRKMEESREAQTITKIKIYQEKPRYKVGFFNFKQGHIFFWESNQEAPYLFFLIHLSKLWALKSWKFVASLSLSLSASKLKAQQMQFYYSCESKNISLSLHKHWPCLLGAQVELFIGRQHKNPTKSWGEMRNWLPLNWILILLLIKSFIKAIWFSWKLKKDMRWGPLA